MPGGKHKTFEEVTKLTGISGVGLERKFEGNCRKIEVNLRVLRIGVIWKPDDN